MKLDARGPDLIKKVMSPLKTEPDIVNVYFTKNDDDPARWYYNAETYDITLICGRNNLDYALDILGGETEFTKVDPSTPDTSSPTDSVLHPSHYAESDVECIDAIKASMTPDEFAGYCKGNIEKYVWRYSGKNGVEDLEKAQVYLTWLINTLKGEKLTK